MRIDRAVGHMKNEGPGSREFRLRARVQSEIERPFGNRNVARDGDEGSELGIGHRIDIHPEAVDAHGVRRTFLRIVPIRPHANGAAWNPNHTHGRTSSTYGGFGAVNARTGT
jgi:hypothetical protein